MSTLIITTCPTWCSTHTVEDGITLHERHVAGERWDFILTHDDDGTTVDIEVPGDRGLTPSEALALGVALVEAAATVGQAEAEATTDDDDLPTRRYSTRAEAIACEVVEPLGEYADAHDVEAIADEVIESTGSGTQLRFRCAVDVPTFWGIVEHHAKPGA